MNENFKVFSSLLGFALFLYGAYGIFMASSREINLIAGEICFMGFGFPMMAANMSASVKLQNIIGWLLISICAFIFYHKTKIFDLSLETINFILIAIYIISLGLVGVESNSDLDDHSHIDVD
jgi:hypothetical protein